MDPFLLEYVTTVRDALVGLTDRDTIDVAAGGAWVSRLGFRSYTPVDVQPPHEIWDIQTPLPAHHVGGYDLALCLGALHYSSDPHRSLGEILRALRPDGDLVIMVPWLFPPHDRAIDRWRIAPRQLHTMLSPHFASLDLWMVGNVFQMPLHVLRRVFVGPFTGVGADRLRGLSSRHAARRLRPATVDDVPTSWLGPVNVLAHARGLRSEGVS